ncbi:phage tail protein [Moraxella nasovis]|uniref:TipJ family phage tail tip protein n=1 Tax=Moraxella nasovis TaxID=2904121 RepID=UPI001F602843|nr:phage tail protein [Moraxella nasovis]UNU73291.1 phage tail protein [Moraxella nasovis]
MQIQGAKKKKDAKPNIAKDTAQSTTVLQAMYGLSEGEVAGLVDGGKSIKLDGTPIINDNGEPNFDGVEWSYRAGTLDQTHIDGFNAVENEIGVGVELNSSRDFVKEITNTQLSAVVVRIGFNGLYKTHDNGDVGAYRIDYAIDLQTDNGAYLTVLDTFIDEKASQGYQKSHRINLPKAKNHWTIRVRRKTPNQNSELIGDKMRIIALTEVVDAKLRYPCTALLALKYDANTFGNIAKLSVRMRGMIIQVPTNYDPVTRIYTGLWDGRFKMAYSDNPAWVLYDICTHTRYGLGNRLDGKVDKWSLYQLAQYCDELVDDGRGGREPRFRVNVYIQQAQNAFSVLQNLSSIFRAMSFWDGEKIVFDADTPKEPSYHFNTANVVNGEFVYTGTRARDRHTIAQIAYDDPDNDFKTDYVHVKDEQAIAKYGIRIVKINAFGCTSRTQAIRAGRWALLSEQMQTQTVSFSVGLDGFIPKVGDVISITDNRRAGLSGRIVGSANLVESMTPTTTSNHLIVGLALKQAFNDGDKVTISLSATDGEYLIYNSESAAANEIGRINVVDGTARAVMTWNVGKSGNSHLYIYRTSTRQERTINQVTLTATKTRHVVLDRTPKDQDSIIVGGRTLSVESINGNELLLSDKVNIGDVWSMGGADNYRILHMTHNDDHTFSITALQYEIAKFSVAEHGYTIPPKPVKVHEQVLTAPSSVNISQFNYTHQGLNQIKITIDYSQVLAADYYVVEYNKDGTGWKLLGETTATSIDIDNAVAGEYLARVKAVDGFGNSSRYTLSHQTTITDKTAPPKPLSSFSGKGILFGIDLSWQYSDDTDIAFAEIEVSDDKQTTSILGQYAYPTNTANITGLQGNLTRHYRARSVDKLGNVSTWSEWQTITTSADTSQILSLLSDDITGDMLDNALRGKINTAYDKSGQNETNLATEIQNRTAAINQEIQNRTQAINAKTGEVRGLLNGLQTGLTQRIDDVSDANRQTLSELNGYKTANDRAVAGVVQQVNAISDNTQAASSRLDGLQSRFDGVLNSKNLLQNTTNSTTDQFLVASYPIVKNIATGQKVLVSITTDPQSELLVYNSSAAGANSIGRITANGTPQQLTWNAGISGNNALHFYRTNIRDTSRISVSNASLKVIDGAIDDVSADLTEFKQTQTTATQALSEKTEQLRADLGSKANASALNNYYTKAQTDNVVSGQIRQFNSRLNGKADSSALNSLTSTVTQHGRDIRATSQKVTQLETSVNGYSTKIRNVEQSIDGVSAIKAVTVDNNGVISGYGLISELKNGRVTSRFGINADQFYLGNPNDGKKPFIVNTSPRTINGVRYPAGTFIDSAYIANASIDNAKIADGAITNAKIDNGAITNAKIGIAQVDTLQIAGEAVIVPRAQSFQNIRTFEVGGTDDLFTLTIDGIVGGTPILINAFLYAEFVANQAIPIPPTLQVNLYRDNHVIYSEMFAEVTTTPLFSESSDCWEEEEWGERGRPIRRRVCGPPRIRQIGTHSTVKGNFILGGLVDYTTKTSHAYKLSITTTKPANYNGELTIRRGSLSVMAVKR